METAVIIPTYNERENVEALWAQLRRQYPRLHAVIVDDNSPDGTGQWAEERARSDPRLHAVCRPGKLGFASAVITGFRYALENGADTILAMDADLSHDPAHIEQIITTLRNNDLVIGSRYIPAGGTRNWGLLRRWLSRGANEFARRLLLLPVRDCTSGFRCYRRQTLADLPLDRIRTEGYSFQIQMTFLCHQRGHRIAEVPITFIDRRHGRSKISRRIIWEAFWLVLRLAWQQRYRPGSKGSEDGSSSRTGNPASL